MTKDELNAFRKILESKQADLQPESREALAIESSPDEMDRIQQLSEREYAMNHLQRNFNRLREVRSALARIEAGTFGVCVECEEDINLKRLAAVPWASMCISCQEAAERAPKDHEAELDPSLVEAA